LLRLIILKIIHINWHNRQFCLNTVLFEDHCDWPRGNSAGHLVGSFLNSIWSCSIFNPEECKIISREMRNNEELFLRFLIKRWISYKCGHKYFNAVWFILSPLLLVIIVLIMNKYMNKYNVICMLFALSAP